MFSPLPIFPCPPVMIMNGMVISSAVTTARIGTSEGEMHCHARTGAGDCRSVTDIDGSFRLDACHQQAAQVACRALNRHIVHDFAAEHHHYPVGEREDF